MTANRTDLLSVTRSLLSWAFLIDCGLLLLAAVVLVGSLFADPATTDIHFSDSDGMSPEQRLFAVRVMVAVGLACCALALPVLRWMLAIVDSARNGDPFVPENGARLRRIGWLILVVNILGFLVSLVLPPFIQYQQASVPGLFCALLIFVLARIFETGTRMRAEIQETI